MKIFCIIVCLLSAIFDPSMSVDVECDYKTGNHFQVPYEMYYCAVSNIKISTLESAVITGVIGDHKSVKSSRGSLEITDTTKDHDSYKNNDDVLGFISEYSQIRFFPSKLDKIFKNLRMIVIWHGPLKEIHQHDLKPFPELQLLSLSHNNIKIIEEGIFDFNPKLKAVGLSYNSIVQIHPNVFDRLTKLTSLHLLENRCIDMMAYENSTTTVQEVIEKVKLDC